MYSEWASTLPYVVAWRAVTPAGAAEGRVLPDGCLDIIWQDGHVFVAGPDTTAQITAPVPGRRFAALRFAAGTGPAVLGVPADELTDRQVPLADLWPAAEVRRLAEATDPVDALVRVARQRWQPPDRAMVALHAGARAGSAVDAIADACGLGPRHLLRRSRTAFGYGPKRLTRILRLQTAVRLARSGRPFADVAAAAGYADQAHLARDARALARASLSGLFQSGA